MSDKGDAFLKIFGDDANDTIAYLGGNASENDEMMLHLISRSKTDKKSAAIQIDGNGGRFDSFNSMGKNVVRLTVGDSGGGLDLRDKYGYVK